MGAAGPYSCIVTLSNTKSRVVDVQFTVAETIYWIKWFNLETSPAKDISESWKKTFN